MKIELDDTVQVMLAAVAAHLEEMTQFESWNEPAKGTESVYLNIARCQGLISAISVSLLESGLPPDEKLPF